MCALWLSDLLFPMVALRIFCLVISLSSRYCLFLFSILQSFIINIESIEKITRVVEKYFTIPSVATTIRHNTNLLHLLWPMIITGGRIQLQQTIEEGVINYHITDNPLLFTSSVEGDIIAIRKFYSKKTPFTLVFSSWNLILYMRYALRKIIEWKI